MGWMRIRRLAEVDGGHRYAIAGFAGVANVGEQTVSHVRSSLGGRPVVEIYSEYLLLPGNMAGISVSEDGSFELPSIRISEAEAPSGKILLVSSPVQPLPWGQMEVADAVVGELRAMGCETLIVVTGFAEEEMSGSVLVFGGDRETVDLLVGAGAREVEPMRSIVGLAGALLATAKIEGMRFVSVTGVAEAVSTDPRAAREVLRVLSSGLNLNLDLSKVEREVEEYEELKRRVLSELERQLQALGEEGRPPIESDYVG